MGDSRNVVTECRKNTIPERKTEVSYLQIKVKVKKVMILLFTTCYISSSQKLNDCTSAD